jgi:hypothetical protein
LPGLPLQPISEIAQQPDSSNDSRLLRSTAIRTAIHWAVS